PSRRPVRRPEAGSGAGDPARRRARGALARRADPRPGLRRQAATLRPDRWDRRPGNGGDGRHPRRRVRRRDGSPRGGHGRRRDRRRRSHRGGGRVVAGVRAPGRQGAGRRLADRRRRGGRIGAGMSGRRSILAVSGRAKLTLVFAAFASAVAFVWPLFAGAEAVVAGSDAAPLLFALVLPLVTAVAAAEISTGGFDAKTVAMLGVLAALGAALRPLGAGAGGIEPVFFLIVLGGRVFGPGFGFVLGSTTLAVSALITAGVGPWLPYQMLAAAWVGLGAGLLPQAKGRVELGMLAVYGAVASFAFGLLMNLSFWPFTLGPDTSMSFVAGAPIWENLKRFLAFEVVTSFAWEVGRAITTAVLILVVGGTILRTLRRASARAAFDSKPVFEPTGPGR